MAVPWPWPTRMPNVVALEAIVRLLAERGVPVAAPKDRGYLIDLMRKHGYDIPGDPRWQGEQLLKVWPWPGMNPTNEQLRSVLRDDGAAPGLHDSRDSLLRAMRKVGYALPVGAALSDPSQPADDTETEAGRLRMIGLNTQLAIEAYRLRLIAEHRFDRAQTRSCSKRLQGTRST